MRASRAVKPTRQIASPGDIEAFGQPLADEAQEVVDGRLGGGAGAC